MYVYWIHSKITVVFKNSIPQVKTQPSLVTFPSDIYFFFFFHPASIKINVTSSIPIETWITWSKDTLSGLLKRLHCILLLPQKKEQNHIAPFSQPTICQRIVTDSHSEESWIDRVCLLHHWGAFDKPSLSARFLAFPSAFISGVSWSAAFVSHYPISSG